MNQKTPTTSEPKPQDRLRSVLTAMGIKRACFVDDKFSPSFATAFSSSLRAMQAGRTAELVAAWSCGTWTAESEEDDRADAKKHWESLDQPGRGALVQKVATLSPDPPQPPEASLFAAYWPHADCPLEEVGPERFDEAYIRAFVLDKGPSILFVDVSLGEGHEEGGLRLLADVRRIDAERKAICAFLTNRPEAEAGGQAAADYLDSLVQQSKVDPGAAVVISKKAAEDVLQFEPELRKAFLNGLSPDLRNWAKGVAEKALNDSLAAFRIEGDVLNAVVLQSSEREGVHPADTLFRLIDTGFRDARDRLAVSEAELAKFGTLTGKLEALARLTPSTEADAPLTSRVKALRRSELYRDRAAVGWPTPISLGDLWEVTLVAESKEAVQRFVLIAQPCDIILRSTNGRRSQEWVLLAPINKSGNAETTVELPYFDAPSFESCRADLKRACVANVNVLDLVALVGPKVDKETIARLQGLPHVHASVAKRAAHLALWLQQALTAIPNTSALSLFPGAGPMAKLSIADGAIDFHCRCLGRIEPDLARLVLQRYGTFVARPGLPHDFARQDN